MKGRQFDAQWWPNAITLLNVTVAAGFSIAGLVKPDFVLPPDVLPSSAGMVFALYAAARSIPLAAAVYLCISSGRARATLVLAVLAGTIQLLDGVVGVIDEDPAKAIGPFALALMQGAAVQAMMRDLRLRSAG